MCYITHAHAHQVLFRKLGYRRGGAGLERCDPRAEGAREQAECSQALGGGAVMAVCCICVSALIL